MSASSSPRPELPPSAVTHPCPAGLPAPSRWLSLVQVVATPYWPAIAISHLPNGGTRPRPSPAPGAPPSAGPARRSAPRTPVTTVLSRPADPPPGAWLRAVVTRCCPGYLVLSREPPIRYLNFHSSFPSGCDRRPLDIAYR